MVKWVTVTKEFVLKRNSQVKQLPKRSKLKQIRNDNQTVLKATFFENNKMTSNMKQKKSMLFGSIFWHPYEYGTQGGLHLCTPFLCH